MAAQVTDDEANAALVLAALARCGSTTDPRYGPATIMQDDDTAGRCMDVDTVRRAMNRLEQWRLLSQSNNVRRSTHDRGPATSRGGTVEAPHQSTATPRKPSRWIGPIQIQWARPYGAMPISGPGEGVLVDALVGPRARGPLPGRARETAGVGGRAPVVPLLFFMPRTGQSGGRAHTVKTGSDRQKTESVTQLRLSVNWAQ